MKSQKLDFSNARDRLLAEETFHFPKSRFAFLNDHFGLRKKHIHVLAAEPGGGKSTLVRAIIEDMENVPILFVGTEEDRQQQEIKFLKTGKREGDLSRIRFVNEREIFSCQDPRPADVKEYIRLLFVEVASSGAKIVFFDNLTTSKFFKAQRIENQELFMEEFKNFAQILEVCVFFIIHIKRDKFSKGIPSMNEIRGGQTVTMRAENLYVVGKIKIPSTGTLYDDELKFFVIVEKDRHGENTGKMYMLDYHTETASVVSDVKVNWNKFKELYDKRAKI